MKNLLLLMMMIQGDFEIQGHRGARGLMPENTIPAFKKALELGVHTLELDVVISKDRKVVVSHEAFFNPDISTDPDGKEVKKESDYNLYAMDYALIKKFDVGLRGNPKFPQQARIKAYKPLLSEVFTEVAEYCKQHKIKEPKYNIELKSEEKEYNISQPEVKEFCALVLAQIPTRLNSSNLCLQSFDFNVLKYLHGLQSKKFILSALLEPLVDNDVQTNIAKLGFKPDIWSPFYITLTEARVTELHSLGIKVIPWTVNDVQSMAAMKRIKTDGLISDYPDKALTLKP